MAEKAPAQIDMLADETVAEKAAGFDTEKVDALIAGDGGRLHRYASRYMRHVVDKPAPCFGIAFGVLLFLVLISIASGFSSTSEENPEDWNVPDSRDTLSYDMLHFAEKAVDKAAVSNTRLAPSLRQSLSFIFRRNTVGADGTIGITPWSFLTPEALSVRYSLYLELNNARGACCTGRSPGWSSSATTSEWR